MNFWKNIFNFRDRIQTTNHLLKQKEEHADYYSDSWVNSEIAEIEKPIGELIYQVDLNENLINDYLGRESGSDFDGSGWPEKGGLNFPGPFYTGESDSCGTGIIESPNNVVFDENCMEYVMIQPRNKVELIQLRSASAVEVFGSYYCDGNKFWTVELVKNWWKNRNDIFEHLKHDELVKMNCNQEKRYKYYLENEALMDLRRYCFFLESGVYPSDEKLPEIE